MTVCIAARAIDGSIFCAADRKVTVGDIEMESPAKKIFMLTNSIVVMPSDDDAALHTEIMNDTYKAINEQIAANPTRWALVRECVEAYVSARDKMRTKLAARTFLTPLGMTSESFLDRMGSLEPSLVSRIAEDLISYKLPSMSVIIAGLDPDGSHIYEVHDGETGCFNTIGFAAIGAGARHARAQFLVAGQASLTSVAETLWNTYLAKKRSEVAPGVGLDTDIGMIGPQIGFNIDLKTPQRPDVFLKLEEVYKKTVRPKTGPEKRPRRKW